MRTAALFIALTLLFGCQTKPSNPQQAVFETKQSFELALTIAVAYDNLPPCTSGVSLCSTPAVKAKLKQAVDVAAPAVQAAEDAVRNPAFDASKEGAILASAQAAVVALAAITATLNIH